MTRATLVLLLAALALTATMPLRPSQSLTAGRTPPNASTRPLDGSARLLGAFSRSAKEEMAFPNRTDGGDPSPPSAPGLLTVVVGGSGNQTDEAGPTDSPVSGSASSATLDLKDWALATPLVGFGGLHPIAESWSRGVASGIASTVGGRFPDWYLALPIGPGFRVRIVGAGGSVERVSTDAGPALHLQRRPYNRVADLSVHDFVAVCGVPVSFGLCRVSISVVGRVR